MAKLAADAQLSRFVVNFVFRDRITTAIVAQVAEQTKKADRSPVRLINVMWSSVQPGWRRF
jgi:hypothetical protein